MYKLLPALLALFAVVQIQAQEKFDQLVKELPGPNVYRTASGAPGPQYYQQQADYKMDVKLDDDRSILYGEETITYHNNSPETLTYLWLQLDQNRRQKHSLGDRMSTNAIKPKMEIGELAQYHKNFDGGFKIDYVKDASDKDLHYFINETMMRVDLTKPLASGQKVSFKIKWWFNINDRMKIGGRSGYEYFEKDSNKLYGLAQFFPRMAVYNDVEGWQHAQFYGRREFALAFGDYEVNITVPADHIVASTGELQNANQVLTEEQKARFAEAKKNFNDPVIIANQAEAIEREKIKLKEEKTWTFKAKNVRDFGFATSRKFIWDAMAVKMGDRTVMAMSYYPKEGNPLWEQYSTEVVAHTLKSYSKYTFDYPYPVAISVNCKNQGMEYPMICYNFGRPEEDGTYNERTKWGMIGVIIHEVGHNYFPMIVNSDERKWTWMDEGLNTYLEYLTEVSWDRDFPIDRGPAHMITDYMAGNNGKGIAPIMTDALGIYQFGNNQYAKAATGLNILRETILGRELMDFAFKTYCERWMFKHPAPADFFRTIEDASGHDLDWFWKGWFYSTDPCDISLEYVKWYKPKSKNPVIDKVNDEREKSNKNNGIGDIRNNQEREVLQTYVESDSKLLDFYNTNNRFKVDTVDKIEENNFLAMVSEEELKYIDQQYNYYELTFENKGGLVMPIILQMQFEDGSHQTIKIPVHIWQKDPLKVKKVFVTDKEVKVFKVDPYLETADIDLYNNAWPRTMVPSRFDVYKNQTEKIENPMQRNNRAKTLEAGTDEQ